MASETNDQQQQTGSKLKREMRVDAAHPLRGEVAQSTEEAVSEANKPALVATSEQELGSEEDSTLAKILDTNGSPEVLARQATDLADHLQSRLSEVDRRDARLNSQEAEFESRIRNARLWLEER